MHEPGARVEGHRSVVRGDGHTTEVVCSCGQPFGPQASVPSACLVLVRHLQTAVRQGAQVLPGDDDGGLAGVREPRRPVPSSGSGSVELDIA